MPRKGWPLAPAFGGCGLDRAWRSAEVCHQEIDGEVWPRCNFKPLVFSQFRTAVDTRIDIAKLDGSYPPLVARRRRSRLRKRRTLSSGRRRRPPGYSSPLSPNDLTSGGKGAAKSCYFEVFVSVS